MKSSLGVLGLVLSVTACSGPVNRADGGRGLLPIGSRAPDVVAKDGSDHEVRLSEMRDKLVVVYFYPGDGLPGCTKEACAFRDAWKKLEKANVAVIGISKDTGERHAKFQHDEKLPFPLASDDAGSIAAAYGVSKTPWGYDRVTFLVDHEGRIARVWAEVDPAVHAEAVLHEAERVQRSSR